MIEKTAVILAGGQSSRMNHRNKAFLKLKGKTFIQQIINQVSSYKEIIIVSNDPKQYEHLGIRVITDIISGKGPISGIHAALKVAKYQKVLFLACDMPFVTKEVINYLGQLEGRAEAIIPKYEGSAQPLCGIYDKRCLPIIEEAINNHQYKLMKVLEQLKVQWISDEQCNQLYDTKDVFKNINTPEQYKQECMPPVVNIIASHSNVGKTTFMEKLIRELKQKHYKVGTIKHDVHGFDIDKPGKDTWKHARAGADTIMISSPWKMAMIRNVDDEWNLSDLVELQKDMDIILVEGYKNSEYPKIEIYRKEICTELYARPDQLLCIASNTKHDITDVPVYDIEDAESIASYIEKKFL